MAETTPPTAKRPWWIFTTYFAEGFPYSLVRLMSTAYFKDHGASLQAIGLTSLLGIPWTVKFLWAPLVDAFATKRRWLLTVEAGGGGRASPLLGVASATPQPLVIGRGGLPAAGVHGGDPRHRHRRLLPRGPRPDRPGALRRLPVGGLPGGADHRRRRHRLGLRPLLVAGRLPGRGGASWRRLWALHTARLAADRAAEAAGERAAPLPAPAPPPSSWWWRRPSRWSGSGPLSAARGAGGRHRSPRARSPPRGGS